VLRLVGVATLIGHRVAGDAKLTSCADGYGPIILTPEAAADLLLSNRPVRIPADSEQAVRSAIAERALHGKGPEEAAKIWDGRELREDN
jgi:hypothetical protein